LEHEQTIAANERSRARFVGSFVKHSKHGHARLKLTAQEDGIAMPAYGLGGSVEGVVELDDEKTEGVDSVQVKIEGRLKLQELGESGDSTAQLVLDTKLLWVKSPVSQECPKALDFRLTLPTTFTHEGVTHPLPPTYEIKLKGIPGFTARIEYSVTALINRPSTVPSMVPLVKSKTLKLNIGTTVVSTPFLYYPRSRPSSPPPPPLTWTPSKGFNLTDAWSAFETTSKAKQSRLQDVIVKLHIPRSRIFCFTQRIPFYLSIESSAVSLAAFLPFAPTTGPMNSKVAMRIEVLRQTTVDVKYANSTNRHARQDMWRVDSIGDGRFNSHLGNEKTMSAFSGEIGILDLVQIGGFKAAGLSVKDCIVLSMTPLDPGKCPFRDFRLIVPIRLATNVWTADGSGIGLARDSVRTPTGSNEQTSIPSIPSTPSDGDGPQ
ncbi:hypothetical protein AN958_03711, partial [Leucoagaricus sp. SymC.cos]